MVGPLPTAKKDVSANPGKLGVTRPMDAKARDADIDRKLRLYGVVEAFRGGKYPSNAQIDETLSYALAHSPVDVSKLSPGGRQLIEDIRAIITTAKLIVDEKNAGELIQNFLYHTREIDYDEHASKFKKNATATEAKPTDEKSEAAQASEHLRTLAKLIYTSSEARKLLKDVGIIGRDIAADGAANLTDKARPNEAELSQVDQPAPDNEWIGPNGEKLGANDAAPDTGIQAKRELSERKAAGQSAEAAVAAKQAKDHANAQTGQNASTSEKAKKGLSAFGDRIPEKYRQDASKYHEDTKNYLREKIPKERQDIFIHRLKKVVVEQQRHRDYQDAVGFFLNMLESYKTKANAEGGKQFGNLSSVRNSSDFKQAETELRTLLERFANGASISPIFDSLNKIYEAADKDENLRSWFKRLDTYARKVLQEPGYILEEQSDTEGREIFNDSEKVFTGQHAELRQNLFDEVSKFFTSYADDPLNVRFGQNWKKLTKDLFLNSEGQPTIKKDLWDDITQVIAPTLLKQIGYVPIPRIEYTDRMIDLVIENLTIEGQNIVPNHIEVQTFNHFKMSPYKALGGKNQHNLTLSFQQIQTDIRDVAFYVHKKSGFPKIKDSGLLDILLSGKGVSGTVEVESSTRSDHVFIVKKVNAKIDKISFSIRDSKHDLLYSTFRPLAQFLIKKQVAKAIEDGIRSALEKLDEQLVDIRERLDAAEGEDGTSKMDAIKQTFQSDKAEKEKAEKNSTKSDADKGTFQIVGKRDSKIVDWASKNSIVEKQGERFDAIEKSALSGKAWHSSAFDIVPGSGKSTTGSSSAAKTTGTGSGAGVAGAAAGGAAGGAAAGTAGGAAAGHSGAFDAAKSDPSSALNTAKSHLDSAQANTSSNTGSDAVGVAKSAVDQAGKAL